MPGGNGTGPAGMGPMTGRAAGYCAGYPVPGFMNPMPGGAIRGFGSAPYYGGAVSPYGPAGYPAAGYLGAGYPAAGYPMGAYSAFGRFGRGFGQGIGRGIGFGRGRGGGRGFRW